MSSVVLSGDTSGTVTLTVPAVAGTNTVTVPAGTGTMAVQGVSTNIVSGTSVVSTSGTAIDFTGIPSWVKRITVLFNGVSTNGTSILLLQIGAGSVINTGYVSVASVNATNAAQTTGYGVMGVVSAAYTVSGAVRITNITGNTWVSDGVLSSGAGGNVHVSGGTLALSGTLDRVRLTTVNGTDTFDAGSINILYE